MVSTNNPQSLPQILVVDDSAMARAMAVKILSDAGMVVRTAEDGESALREAALHPPDLLLLDLWMPGEDGIAVCRRFKAEPAWHNLPIIFISASNKVEDKVAALSAGAVDFVTKPFSDTEVLARVQTHLALRQARRELIQRNEELSTIRHRLEERVAELQRTRDRLVAAEKMASLGRLVAGFAHEINTPLGIAVGSFSQLRETLTELEGLLQADTVDEAQLRELLEIIDETGRLTHTNLQRTADLVQRFRRSSVDQTSGGVRRFKLREVIDDALSNLRSPLKTLKVITRVECPDGLVIHGTPGMLGQLLVNLIQNSIQHGFGNRPGEGQKTTAAAAWEIRIGCRVVDGVLHLDYADNGRGMTEETVAHAFEPFYTSNRGGGSSGLGLYMSYNLIHRLHGAITCHSTLGKGAQFHVEIPLRPMGSREVPP